MKHVKVDATTSTNETAKVFRKNGFTENFCISAEFQSSGRGQHHKIWVSEKSKNLTFTVVLGNLNLMVDRRFYLNILVCNALHEVLKTYQLPNLLIKWPNDILSDQKKIGGILIENTLNKNFISTTYIGIGLNINQDVFNDLPQASSMKLLLNKEFDRDKILSRLLKTLEALPDRLEGSSVDATVANYKKNLYGYKSQTPFKLHQEKVTGTLQDVEVSGEIKVEFENGVVKCFDHSEIQQLY